MAATLYEDHIWHSQVKHIWVKFHYVCELICLGESIIHHVTSTENIADILTKPLNKTDFLWLCLCLRLHPVSPCDGHAWGGATYNLRRSHHIKQPVTHAYIHIWHFPHTSINNTFHKPFYKHLQHIPMSSYLYLHTHPHPLQGGVLNLAHIRYIMDLSY
jgi:hypothetical protein